MLPNWHHAWGEPPFLASIRQTPSDFLVDERMEIEFSGDGEHDYLHIRKTSCNTGWVAGRLARHAGARDADVGYSGRKDRHAITTQWFSVPARDTDWSSFTEDGIEILDVRRHRKKLRTGTHRSNRFRIALRSTGLPARRAFIDERLCDIARDGVPNYFGPQRFGHGGANIGLARQMFEGKRLSRNKRSIAVSTARSFLFNEILSSRVAAGSWNRILSGEMANLDGSGSVFHVEDVDAELERRCVEMDIHPTGALFGTGDDGPNGEVARIEHEAVAPYGELTDGLERMNVEASRRALRVRISDLDWQLEDDALWLDFSLPKGAFATSVLREIADCNDCRSPPQRAITGQR